MRIVVTGGTGFIGRALVCSLAERGDDVVVLTRGRSKGTAPGPRHNCCRGAGKVELVPWSPEQELGQESGQASGQESGWMRAVDGADAVVNLAGGGLFEERWTPERMDVLRSSRIRSTELLVGAIARAKVKPRVLVSGSAVGYYGTGTGDRVVDESAPPGDDFLAQLTRDWEAAAHRAAELGVRVCTPRAGIVLGARGGMLAKLVPMFKAYMGGPVGDGTQYVPWIHVDDMVAAIEYAIASDHCSGAFNATAPEPVTSNDFARALGAALDRPSSFRVPAVAVRIALGAGADAVLTGQRAIPKRLVEAGFAFIFPELASALADLVGERVAV